MRVVKSRLVFVLDMRDRSWSVASEVLAEESSLRMLKAHSSSSLLSRRSSRRVPDLLRSMAGKMRFSESLRSRWISMLPVPLNSS